MGAKHYHTSAKLNKGIEELFLDLCKRKAHKQEVTSLHCREGVPSVEELPAGFVSVVRDDGDGSG